MATSTGSFPLATESPFTGGDDGSSSQSGTDAGASGPSSGGVQISQGAMIAIIVVVCVVGVIGSKSRNVSPPATKLLTRLEVSSSILFFVAKKREWKVRETIRRSARRVVTALTPRRSEFPKSVKASTGRRGGGRVRLDDVPPTPRIRPDDLEKGLEKADKKRANFSRK